MKTPTDKDLEFLKYKAGPHLGQDESWAVGQGGQETEEHSNRFECEQTDSAPDQSLSYLRHPFRHQSCHLNQGSSEEKTEMPLGRCHDECFV